ncbi:unnamed protein product [Symbiodinium natans]|uniref:Uncharacterized protein n=1 Tax=Symbiodinium natans TaxID=878477 RepID=A0A812NSS9_9DINO|nr:unnamed protein product [Symbiodinium natans]
MASTEFQRASQALEELEARLDELAPPSDEAADWVLLASTSAAERDISVDAKLDVWKEPQRQAFADAEDRPRGLAV